VPELRVRMLTFRWTDFDIADVSQSNIGCGVGSCECTAALFSAQIAKLPDLERSGSVILSVSEPQSLMTRTCSGEN
jgi:hypothetical protein